MRYTVGLAPSAIESGANARITVSNSGTVAAILSAGGLKPLPPGYSRTVNTGGVAVTAMTGVASTTTLEVDSAGALPEDPQSISYGDLDDSLKTAIGNLETLPVSVDAAVGAAKTLDVGYPMHRLTLGAASTFTIPPVAGKRLSLLIVQGIGGPYTVTWPASVRWPAGTAPSLVATTNLIELVCINGTNWEGRSSLALAVPA